MDVFRMNHDSPIKLSSSSVTLRPVNEKILRWTPRRGVEWGSQEPKRGILGYTGLNRQEYTSQTKGACHDQCQVPGCDVAEDWSGRAVSRCSPDAPTTFDRR